MSEDEPTLRGIDAADVDRQILARLEQLERAFGEQSARLHNIERRFGLTDDATQPRPFSPGASPASSTARTTTAAEASQSTSAETSRPTGANGNTEAAKPTPHAAASLPPQWSWQTAAADGQSHDNAAVGAGATAGEASATAAAATAAAAAGASREAGETAGAREEQAASSIIPARRDLEQLIGGSLFNWLGIIAVTLTVGFFLKYAFDNQWIGARGRVLLGGAVGCGILAAAERLRLRGYRSYAYVLSGGGILILYLSVYAARNFYELIGVVLAFALMIVVTTTAVLLAARYNAYAIAVLGLIGGFATPVMLSTRVDNEIGLFTYIALLNAGVLALAYFKRWRSLNHLAFIATVIMFAGWYLEWYAPSKLWPTVFFLALFFLMFNALGVIYNVVKLRPARWFDISLIISNATLYFATNYALLETTHHNILGSFALVWSAFYVLLFYFTYLRHRADLLLSLSYVGAAATFFTLAVAIQLDQHWVTMGWAVEGLMLTWIGLRADTDAPRYAALPVFAFAVIHWFNTDLPAFAYRANETFVPLLNRRAASAAVLIAALAATVWLYRRAGEKVDADEREIITTVLVLAANALALTILTIDTSDYFNARGALLPGELLEANENTRQFSFTVLWTLYAAAALAVGITRRLLPLRLGALLLLGIAVVKLVTLDVSFYSASRHLFVFNQTFLAFAVVVAALAFSVRLYGRAAAEEFERERTAVVPVLLAVANLLAVVGLSVEAMGYFNRSKTLAWATGDSDDGQFGIARNLENTKQMILTFIWTIYAAVACTLGFRRGRQLVRLGALGLLALTGVKILLLDAGFYASPFHLLLANQTFAAFAVFVLALWYLAARLYARAGDAIDAEELRLVRPVLTVAGNLFALIALSLEASGYFKSQFRNGALTSEALRDLRLAQGLSLSVVWTLYGGAMLLYGHWRSNRLLRVMALLLLTATTFKVFFLDLAALEKIYRIVSFLVLGAILLAVSFLYQQRLRASKPEES